jgi:hypothetical protein
MSHLLTPNRFCKGHFVVGPFPLQDRLRKASEARRAVPVVTVLLDDDASCPHWTCVLPRLLSALCPKRRRFAKTSATGIVTQVWQRLRVQVHGVRNTSATTDSVATSPLLQGYFPYYRYDTAAVSGLVVSLSLAVRSRDRIDVTVSRADAVTSPPAHSQPGPTGTYAYIQVEQHL